MIQLSDDLPAKKSFRLKPAIENIQPRRLHEAAAELEAKHSGLSVKTAPKDMEKLLSDFHFDITSLSQEDIFRKWSRRKRSLLDIVIIAGRKQSHEAFDQRERWSILENAFLVLLSSKTLLPRYLEAIGIAVLNNMGNETLWRMFFQAIEKADNRLGKRASVWKKYITDLPSPERIVKKELNTTSLENIERYFAVEGTWTGTRILRTALHEIAKQDLVNYYETELFGDFIQGKTHSPNMGFLGDIEIDVLSAFINSYCAEVKGVPLEDKHLDYLVSSRIMDVPSAGVKWLHPLIHDKSRKVVESYLLGVDFRMAFDHILLHQERKRYWMRWLESGHVKRIRVFGSHSQLAHHSFNCPTGIMEFPTLQMDLGPCYVFECGEHGSGALYAYPSNGPINWNHKKRHTRSYKAPILDSYAGVSRRWLKISHSGNWQSKVDNALRDHYRLQR